MRIIDPSYEIISFPTGKQVLEIIERAGRVCWKSEDKIQEGSAEGFVGRIVKTGHESVIEHQSATVLFTCDRGVTHELVRHRLCSFSQESTRYANYANGKFNSEITVIKTPFYEVGTIQYSLWESACLNAEEAYLKLIASGSKAEEARSILPNSLKTELYMTTNMREWRHVFKLRCANGAHPQVRELMLPLLNEFAHRVPVLFDDLNEKFNGVYYG